MSGLFERWRKPLVLASVGLNLFLVGTIIPHLLDHHRPDGRMDGPPPGMFFHPRPLEELLPPADAALLRHALGDSQDLRALEQRTRTAWDHARQALRSTPFDRQAFAASANEVMAARRAFEASRQSAILDAIGQMSPEGRQRLANLNAPFLMGGGHHGPLPPPPDMDQGHGEGPPPDFGHGSFDHRNDASDGNQGSTPPPH